MINKFFLIFLLSLPFQVHASKLNEINAFNFTEEQIQLAIEIIQKLESNHLVKKEYREIKYEAFEVFIERLDPNKNIYTDKEVLKVLSSIKTESGIKEDLQIAYDLFNKYIDRYQERYKVQIEFLKVVDEEDLQGDRKIERSLSEASRQISSEALRGLWQDLSTNDVIQLMLAGNSLDESVEKTIKRMNNQLNYFQQTRGEDVFNIFVNSIASIYGPHTSYMSPKTSEDFDINMSLSLEGIGALLSSDGLYTSISSLVPGGPAEKTDLLKPEDKIIGVGQDAEGEIVDVIGWRIDDVVDLIRGPKGSKVRLEIIPSTALSDTETKEVEIIRNVVKLEDQAAEKKILSLTRNNKEYKVGVIQLPAFYFDFDAEALNLFTKTTSGLSKN